MLCTWFLNKVKPILLAYGCPLANDSARLLTKLHTLPLVAWVVQMDQHMPQL